MLKKCDGRTNERTNEQTNLCIELRYAQLIKKIKYQLTHNNSENDKSQQSFEDLCLDHRCWLLLPKRKSDRDRVLICVHCGVTDADAG